MLLPLLREQVSRVVRSTTPATVALTQRAVAGVLRLCTRLLMYRSDVTDELVDCLKARSHPTPCTCPPCRPERSAVTLRACHVTWGKPRCIRDPEVQQSRLAGRPKQVAAGPLSRV